MLELGLIPDSLTVLFDLVERDVSELFDKAKITIEDLAKNNETDLINSLKETVKFLDSEKELAENMKPITLCGRIFKRFINDMVEQVIFILRQHIYRAQGQSFVKFRKADLLSVIEFTKKDALVTMINMKNDKAAQIINSSEVIRLARKYLEETNELKAINTISKYFKDGVNLTLRKIVAAKTYLLNKSY